MPDRRAVLKGAVAAAAYAALPGAARADEPPSADQEARFWEPLEDGRVRCTLCPRRCEVAAGRRGLCGVRENRDGRYVSLNWGRVCSENVDPIEKKPLFHFRPGTRTYSLAAPGCNISCAFCQNWQISQVPIEQVGTEARTPADVVDACAARGLPTLSLTYSEPVVWWEFGHEIAVAAKDRGIDTVAITNGYIEREPLDRWCDVLRAIKVDFKAFTRRFYRDQCSGDLGPVLDTLVRIRERGVWLELVVLIVPTLNDDASEVGAMARWIVQQLGPDVPLHFTRFHPTYRLTELEPTPVSTLERCREIALEAGVHFVYTGNTPRHPGENTICPTSGEVLVERAGFSVIRNRIVDGRCPCCDRPVPGVW